MKLRRLDFSGARASVRRRVDQSNRCGVISALRLRGVFRPRKIQAARALKRVRAFTLTDALVVAAVLSVLGAVGLSRAAAAREKARLAVCLANLGAVDRCLHDFTADNNSTFPGLADENDNRPPWWWYKEKVKKYAGLTGDPSPKETMFACPEDRGYSDPMPFHLNSRFAYNSYVLNAVTLPGLPNIAGLPMSSIRNPKRTLAVMEWTAHAPLSWHRSKTGRENSPFYRDAESVVGFVDGHASLIPIYYDGYNAAYTQDPISGYDYQFSPR
jgi:type II secretory pathway pseudopilin PulG